MSLNLDRLIRVAERARPLLDRLVFVGGSVVELYFTDPASGRVRPTRDADAVCEAATYVAYGHIAAELRKLGFYQAADQNDPIYRWRMGEDILDVMPVAAEVLGFTNPWYAEGLTRAIEAELSDNLRIQIFPPPVFLASKLAAYERRGRDDPYVSQDLEDIVALITNRPEIVREVQEKPVELRRWIAEHLHEALGKQEARGILQGHLPELAWTPGLRENVEERILKMTEIE